jgi:hypothetical protein
VIVEKTYNHDPSRVTFTAVLDFAYSTLDTIPYKLRKSVQSDRLEQDTLPTLLPGINKPHSVYLGWKFPYIG